MEATKAQLETFNWFTFVVCCLKIRLHHFYYENFRSINEPRKQKRAIVFPYSTACLVDLNALPHQPQAKPRRDKSRYPLTSLTQSAEEAIRWIRVLELFSTFLYLDIISIAGDV